MSIEIKKIVNTVKTLSEAIEAAKEMGNDIFAGYTNSIAMNRRINDKMGVTEYMIMDTAEIFYVVNYRGEKLLNKTALGSSLTSGPLICARQINDEIVFITSANVDKSDQKARRATCDEGFFLTDPSMANAPRVYDYS